jgi:hypothetical protein
LTTIAVDQYMLKLERNGTHEFRTPDMSVRESGKAENTGYPQQCGDGNNVESPSKDDTLI